MNDCEGAAILQQIKDALDGGIIGKSGSDTDSESRGKQTVPDAPQFIRHSSSQFSEVPEQEYIDIDEYCKRMNEYGSGGDSIPTMDSRSLIGRQQARLDSQQTSLSVDNLHDRIMSFDIVKWSQKPDCISSFQCARFGWKLTEWGFLACVTCKNILHVPTQMSSARGNSWAKRLTEAIKSSGHLSTCPWTRMPSPPDILSIPTGSDLRKYLSEAVESYGSMLVCPALDSHSKSVLVNLSLQWLSDMVAAAKLPAIAENDKNVSPEMFRNVVLFLVLNGWIMDDIDDALNCRLCLRKFPLWVCHESQSENEPEDTLSPVDTNDSTEPSVSNVPDGQISRESPSTVDALKSTEVKEHIVSETVSTAEAVKESAVPIEVTSTPILTAVEVLPSTVDAELTGSTGDRETSTGKAESETKESTETVGIPDSTELTDIKGSLATAEIPDSVKVAETNDSTETAANPDSVEMTETKNMAETVGLPDSVEVTETKETTEAAALPDSVEMTETTEAAALPDSVEMTESTETAALPDSVEMTETKERAETVGKLDSVELTETKGSVETETKETSNANANAENATNTAATHSDTNDTPHSPDSSAVAPRKSSVAKEFNPVTNHWSWCPWRRRLLSSSTTSPDCSLNQSITSISNSTGDVEDTPLKTAAEIEDYERLIDEFQSECASITLHYDKEKTNTQLLGSITSLVDNFITSYTSRTINSPSSESVDSKDNDRHNSAGTSPAIVHEEPDRGETELIAPPKKRIRRELFEVDC